MVKCSFPKKAELEDCFSYVCVCNSTYRSFSQKTPTELFFRFIMNTEKKCINYFYQNTPANERITETIERSSSSIPLQISKRKNKDYKKVKKTSHWSPHLNKMFSSFSAPLSQDSNLFYTIFNKWNTFKIISSTLHCQLQRNVGFLLTSFFLILGLAVHFCLC